MKDSSFLKALGALSLLLINGVFVGVARYWAQKEHERIEMTILCLALLCIITLVWRAKSLTNRVITLICGTLMPLAILYPAMPFNENLEKVGLVSFLAIMTIPFAWNDHNKKEDELITGALLLLVAVLLYINKSSTPPSVLHNSLLTSLVAGSVIYYLYPEEE